MSYKILGIETSCDETALAVVTDEREILAHQIASQTAQHNMYGGVVPEIASRAHLETIGPLFDQTLQEAKCTLGDIDAIAATAGPGLAGGLLVGMTFAKALSLSWDKPFIAVNHLEAHALTPRLSHNVAFPYLLLLISGGHCQILWIQKLGYYELLGETRDDALGEAFDKVARLLGLGYPGGPLIEKAAEQGDPQRFVFPKPLCDKEGCDFSFSGLKTAVARQVESMGNLSEQDIADLAASFQATACHILVNRLTHALETVKHRPFGQVALAGGVAANRMISFALEQCCTSFGRQLITPPPSLCTDNGAMIAWAGLEYFREGHFHDLSTEPRARWPLSNIGTP